jgi:hypothetical protein
MERAGYSRKQLKEAAATFVDALFGDAWGKAPVVAKY